jgi:hypothetical protein
VRLKLEGLEYSFKVFSTLDGVVFTDIDDLTAAATWEILATRSGEDASAVPASRVMDVAIVRQATEVLIAFIVTPDWSQSAPGREQARRHCNAIRRLNVKEPMRAFLTY